MLLGYYKNVVVPVSDPLRHTPPVNIIEESEQKHRGEEEVCLLYQVECWQIFYSLYII